MEENESSRSAQVERLSWGIDVPNRMWRVRKDPWKKAMLARGSNLSFGGQGPVESRGARAFEICRGGDMRVGPTGRHKGVSSYDQSTHKAKRRKIRLLARVQEKVKDPPKRRSR